MAEILKGAPVAAAIIKKASLKAEELKEEGTIPTLAILRVGERGDDVSYEKSIIKKCEQAHVEAKSFVLPEDVKEPDFFKTLNELNESKSVHGILTFMPLPSHIDSKKARDLLSIEKDVDGCTDGSLAGVFANSGRGFSPCTAQAVVEILDFYGYDCIGKRVAVIGRSLVVGRPAAMLLMHRNATPVICHTKTKDVKKITSEADIIIACAGAARSIGAEHVREGQVVIDVGTSWDPVEKKLCGDVRFEEVCDTVCAVTPVPGGVGAVTTAVLISHVVEAAQKSRA